MLRYDDRSRQLELAEEILIYKDTSTATSPLQYTNLIFFKIGVINNFAPFSTSQKALFLCNIFIFSEICTKKFYILFTSHPKPAYIQAFVVCFCNQDYETSQALAHLQNLYLSSYNQVYPL